MNYRNEKYNKAENILKSFLEKDDIYYEVVEDNYEYENGLILIIYYDREHIYEREHICIDVDNVEDLI